jgi:DNA repair exonuclease SbcCD ATPase subunit
MVSTTTSHCLPEVPQIDLNPILRELHDNREAQVKLQESIDSLRNQMQADYALMKNALEEERFRSERLEEQINDLTELQQHEVTNIKQELASMEEKMEYQLDERTRDMQELLETCQTRITKMELQQQQQQLISMEGIENTNFRALLTKLINVVLALLAVILVFVSTVANLLGPFLTTRLRILSTICLIACVVATWQNWSVVRDLGQRMVDHYRHIFPVQ